MARTKKPYVEYREEDDVVPLNPKRETCTPNTSPVAVKTIAETIPAGTNNIYLQLNLEVMHLPDINIKNIDEVRVRIDEYFQIYARYDIKPTVAGLAMALGMSKTAYLEVVRGTNKTLPDAVCRAIQKAHTIMETMWEGYMAGGKVNPVVGIFVAKNMYGYVDKVEHQVTAGVEQPDINADDIRSRYMIEGE